MNTWRVILGDCVERLRELPAESVQCVVTSPPYWGLRDYGVAGQIGLESSPEEWTAKMVEVFREVRRVLRADGVIWVNLGDSYATSAIGAEARTRDGLNARMGRSVGAGKQAETARLHGGIDRTNHGLKPKDLIGIPWRGAFALQADGWWLRSDIIWHKPNPMPESVTDRPTKSHEYLFLLAKSESYFYDSRAVAERAMQPAGQPLLTGQKKRAVLQDLKSSTLGTNAGKSERNRRTVWSIATKPFRGAHFATFPEKLVQPCILAGSKPGDTILDPFSGAATTGVVALKLGRNYVGIELNPEYVRMSRERLAAVAPLLSTEVAA